MYRHNLSHLSPVYSNILQIVLHVCTCKWIYIESLRHIDSIIWLRNMRAGQARARWFSTPPNWSPSFFIPFHQAIYNMYIYIYMCVCVCVYDAYIYTLGAGGSPKVLWVGYCECSKIVISLWWNVSFWRSHFLHRMVFCADDFFFIRALIDEKSIIHTFILARNVWFVW